MAVSSTFDGSENPLRESGGWGAPGGSYHTEIQKISGVITSQGGNEASTVRAGESWNAVQTSEITLTNRGTATTGWMVSVRNNSASGAGYELYRHASLETGELYYHNGSTGFTSLGLGPTNAVDGNNDVVRLDVDDNGAGGNVRLTWYVNDAQVDQREDGSNNLRSGVPGVGGYGSASSWTATAWEGTGEVVAGGASELPAYRRRQQFNPHVRM